jgi:hypothetical protein
MPARLSRRCWPRSTKRRIRVSSAQLADAYNAVADKLPPGDAQANEVLKQVLIAIAQARNQIQLGALADAYEAVAGRLPASALRRNVRDLRHARQLALSNETWGKVAMAELMVLHGRTQNA